jgi:PAS domain S-box-containing protein
MPLRAPKAPFSWIVFTVGAVALIVLSLAVWQYLEKALLPPGADVEALHVVRGAVIGVLVLAMGLWVQRTWIAEAQTQRRLSFEFLEAQPVGVSVIRADGELVYVNQLGQRLLGRGVVVGSAQRLSQAYDVLRAGTDEAYPEEELPAIAALRQGRNITRSDIEVRRLDGLRVPLEASASLLKDAQGNVTHAIVVFSDISQRLEDRRILERSNDLMAAILDGTMDHVHIKNERGEFLTMNRAGAAALGRPVHEIVGRTDSDFYPAAEADQIRASDARVMTTGAGEAVEETMTGLKGPRTMLSSKAPYLGADGSILGVITISRDITERQRYEAALAASNQELERFAYVASHDLQEPVRKVQAFGERLEAKIGDDLSEEARDYLHRMRDAARRMQAMISGLLEFSRVATNRQPPRAFDLKIALQEAMSLLELKIEESKAVIDVQPLPTIEADPSQMRQLFQNILSNALKFQIPGKPPRIQVTAAPTKLGGAAAYTIEISDNGVGFRGDLAPELFQPFRRLHSRAEFEGSGMGLAICRRIVDRHGGEISIRSQPEEGTTVSIKLPMRQDPAEVPI